MSRHLGRRASAGTLAGPAGEDGVRRPGPRRHPERVVQAQIVRLLRSLGSAVYVLGTTRRRGDYPGTMQTPGLPDLYAFLPRGLGAVWIECKAPKGRMSDAQHLFRLQCAGSGVPHVLGGYDDVVAWLIQVGLLKADAVPAYRIGEGT